MTSISPEREHELATLIAKHEAQNALRSTLPIDVMSIIRNFDDISFMPEDDRQALYQRITKLVRTGQVIVTFPQLYVGKADDEPTADNND